MTVDESSTLPPSSPAPRPPRGQAAAPADFSMTMPAAYEVLEEMRKVDQVMQRLQQTVRGAPALVVLPQAGHFVQEHGTSIAQQAVEYFRL